MHRSLEKEVQTRQIARLWARTLGTTVGIADEGQMSTQNLHGIDSMMRETVHEVQATVLGEREVTLRRSAMFANGNDAAGSTLL